MVANPVVVEDVSGKGLTASGLVVAKEAAGVAEGRKLFVFEEDLQSMALCFVE